jgi:D-amino-acid dehydrogenase
VTADVTVIGGGVVGLAVAAELAARGAAVAVLERESSVGIGASFGNAGVVGASHVVPLPSRAAIREGLAGLTRRDSPLALRPRVATAAWLARFVAASSPRREAAATSVLAELADASLTLHRELAERHDTGFRAHGFLSVFETARAFAMAAQEAGRRRAGPIRTQPDEVIDAAAVRRRWPQVTGPLAGALLSPDDAHCDPARVVAALASEAVAHGADIRTGIEVLGARRHGDRIAALLTTAGDLAVGEVVLAAGGWSAPLARRLGARLPIAGGKGYHVEVARSGADADLPIYFPERRIVATPLDRRLRISGTLEITGTDLDVDARRLDAVLASARDRLAGIRERQPVSVWRGLRPCSPDGLPIVGRLPRRANVSAATAHGMWGLQLSLITGRLVAELLSGDVPSHDTTPLAPTRFRSSL